MLCRRPAYVERPTSLTCVYPAFLYEIFLVREIEGRSTLLPGQLDVWQTLRLSAVGQQVGSVLCWLPSAAQPHTTPSNAGEQVESAATKRRRVACVRLASISLWHENRRMRLCDQWDVCPTLAALNGSSRKNNYRMYVKMNYLTPQ